MVMLLKLKSKLFLSKSPLILTILHSLSFFLALACYGLFCFPRISSLHARDSNLFVVAYFSSRTSTTEKLLA